MTSYCLSSPQYPGTLFPIGNRPQKLGRAALSDPDAWYELRVDLTIDPFSGRADVGGGRVVEHRPGPETPGAIEVFELCGGERFPTGWYETDAHGLWAGLADEHALLTPVNCLPLASSDPTVVAYLSDLAHRAGTLGSYARTRAHGSIVSPERLAPLRVGDCFEIDGMAFHIEEVRE